MPRSASCLSDGPARLGVSSAIFAPTKPSKLLKVDVLIRHASMRPFRTTAPIAGDTFSLGDAAGIGPGRLRANVAGAGSGAGRHCGLVAGHLAAAERRSVPARFRSATPNGTTRSTEIHGDRHRNTGWPLASVLALRGNQRNRHGAPVGSKRPSWQVQASGNRLPGFTQGDRCLCPTPSRTRYALRQPSLPHGLTLPTLGHAMTMAMMRVGKVRMRVGQRRVAVSGDRRWIRRGCFLEDRFAFKSIGLP